jgi:hypothetical protein
MSEVHGANTITVHDKTFLLAERGAGEAVHLVREVQSAGEPARPIGDEDDYGGPFNPRYARSELEDPRWAERTLCGRSHWLMAPTDVGDVYAAQDWLRSDPVFAPSCRRCLAILDGLFPAPEGDARLDPVVARCLDEISYWGSAQVDQTPADQIPLLRKRLRAAAKARGWQITTLVHGASVIAASDDALSPERQRAIDQFAAGVIGRLLDGTADDPRTEPPSWRFSWTDVEPFDVD